MYIKGLRKIREKLPRYQGKRIFLLLILALLSFLAGSAFIILIELLPKIFPTINIVVSTEPILPVLGPFICVILGYFFIFNVWHKKEKYLKESMEVAYQRAVKFGIIGLPLIFAVVTDVYIPVDLIFPNLYVNEIAIIFSSSLLFFFPGLEVFDFVFRIVGFLIFLVLGILTLRRSILTFGIDYMAVVYLYYPGESEIQNREIYSVLRHPVYAAVLMICFGGVLSKLSMYAFIIFIMILIGLLIHIRFVEETELIERFGDSYLNYRKEVPAILIRPNKIGAFFKFLAGH
ncbi:MAG: methyltransferase family protein [Candidatus Helarchaeota archaeon]